MKNELIVFTGPMFGGKSSRLLATIDRLKYQSKKIVAFKPKMDHRYSKSEIVTHSGHHYDALSVSTGKEIIDLSKDFDIIAIDEAFMIDGAGNAVIDLFKSGKSVIVSSIKLSANGNVFEEMKTIFPWATKIEICPAVCTECDADAYYTVTNITDLSGICVGGAESYEPKCFKHTHYMKSDD